MNSRLLISLYSMFRKNKRVDLSAMIKLSEIIRVHEIDVVNAHHFMSMVYSFYGCKIAGRKKLIYTEHSKVDLDPISLRWQIIGRFLLKNVDHVVCVSDEVMKNFVQKFGYSSPRWGTIRNGVDLNKFGNGSNENIITTMKKQVDIGNGEKIIGSVANFKKIKNHVFLLEAFKGVLRHVPNAKLLLVGQGFVGDPENSEPMIRDYIRTNNLGNNVKILGYRPDVDRLLRVMDVFCLTSFNEGMPISLIEAMASGIPVVGTNVNGIKDVIIHDFNGILIEGFDVGALERSLVHLLLSDIDRKRLGNNAKDTAKDRYSIEQCIQSYQKLFSPSFVNGIE